MCLFDIQGVRSFIYISARKTFIDITIDIEENGVFAVILGILQKGDLFFIQMKSLLGFFIVWAKEGFFILIEKRERGIIRRRGTPLNHGSCSLAYLHLTLQAHWRSTR